MKLGYTSGTDYYLEFISWLIHCGACHVDTDPSSLRRRIFFDFDWNKCTCLFYNDILINHEFLNKAVLWTETSASESIILNSNINFISNEAANKVER